MTHPVIHHTKRILNKPHYVIPTALGIALIIGVAGFLAYSTSKNYATTPVVIGNVTSSLGTTGIIKASTQTDLAFPKGGRVHSVLVKVGDTVYKGQTLASLDSTDAEGAVEQAQGAYKVAEANYERLTNGASTSDLAIAQTAYDTTVAEQKTAVQTAYEKLLSTDLIPTTNSSNLPAPLISGTFVNDATGVININIYGTGNGAYWTTTGLINATGTVNSQTSQPIGTSGLFILFPGTNMSSYSGTTWTISVPNTSGPNYTLDNGIYQTALQTQSDKIAQAKANLDKVKASPRSEDIAIAEAQVGSAQGALHMAEGNLANDFIVAPIDGTITSVNNLTVGEIVNANNPVIGIMSNNGFQIESYVSQKDLGVVTLSEPVTIVTDAYGPNIVFNGKVIEVAPAATTQDNGQLGYKITYQLTDKDSKIKPGLSANINLNGGKRENVLMIPRTSLFLKDGSSFVLVKNGKNTEDRSIVTGLVGNDNVEVISGLKEGEQIVTLGK